MNLFKKVFRQKDALITKPSEFWDWFVKHEKEFYKAIKEQKAEINFLNKVSPKLKELNEGIFPVVGMIDHNIAELVLTPEGSIKHVVYCEEVVNAAPAIAGWKFTALKTAMDMSSINICMRELEFNTGNIKFYSTNIPGYPDEIDITIVYQGYTSSNEELIKKGCYIFLDNLLGELKSISLIDNIRFAADCLPGAELIPIEKLDEFLTWREKEFIEKYDGKWHNSENDSHSLMEAELENGEAIVAVINQDLMNWDAKGSHPWLLILEMQYKGTAGMPDESTTANMDLIEDEITEYLKDADGYLNLGKETGRNRRLVYFACKEFRKPTIIINNIISKYRNVVKMDFDIYRDKYWRTLDHYSQHHNA